MKDPERSKIRQSPHVHSVLVSRKFHILSRFKDMTIRRETRSPLLQHPLNDISTLDSLEEKPLSDGDPDEIQNPLLSARL